jgi:hypothetical protein
MALTLGKKAASGHLRLGAMLAALGLALFVFGLFIGGGALVLALFTGGLAAVGLGIAALLILLGVGSFLLGLVFLALGLMGK